MSLVTLVEENVLCFDVAIAEVVSLFVFLYYIPYFKNVSTKAYLPEGNADRKVS